MAATSHPLATITAITILQAGGNAMDAAIAACAVLCVFEPQSTGICGDCFCLYSPKGRDVVAFNGAGRAPAAATIDWYRNNNIHAIERHGPHAVTIPGAIDAWSQLLADHGTMGLGEVLQPATRFAADGFPVHHRQQSDWQDSAPLLAREPSAASGYLVNGAAPKIGALVKFPLLAQTLEIIAERGRAGFYEGWVAEDMVQYLRDKGGLHTLDDFASARGEYVTPIKTAYRGYEVYECPPPGQGIVALAMLNILSGFDLAALDPWSVDRFHLEIEAARLAYRDRAVALGDPAFAQIPVEAWLSASHADTERALIQMDRRIDPLPPSDLPRHDDTVYLTVVDKDRNAVSFINSLFASFGSCLVAPKSGIVLHNRGTGLVLNSGHPNCIAPNKRPLHTIIPGMLVKDGITQMPFGVMGGHYQAIGHTHLLTSVIDWQTDLQEAIDMARVFPDVVGQSNQVAVESGLPPDVRAGLTRLGHRIVPSPKPIGGGQAIRIDWDQGVLQGASDPRKDGMAIGY
jgi:gamma-glutamyltranspeptidase/glutathione hydrolase